MLRAVVAANDDKTPEQIRGADDSAILANVNAHVDLFATGS